MTILVTAGTGKTSRKMIPYLKKSNTSFLLTSRSPQATSDGNRYVKFDLVDSSTYANAFPSDLSNKVSTVYLALPVTEPDAPKLAVDFVNYAVKEHGVKRFVMLTGSTAIKGGPHAGEVWQLFEDLGVEYSILRATWFTENFTEWYHHKSIKEEGVIYSCTADGKARYVTTDDIARLAFHALTSPSPLPENIQVLGPDLLNLDEVAQIFTDVLGKPIKHIKQDRETRTMHLAEKDGLLAANAWFMAYLEDRTANGGETFDGDAVEKYTGVKPQSLRAWVVENKSAFA